MAANNEREEDPIPLSAWSTPNLKPEAKEAFVLYSGPKVKERHAKFLDFALKDSWPLYESLCEDRNSGGDESFKNAMLMQLDPTIAASDKQYGLTA
ncbi:hypothetical protein AAVH_30033 [Aphelenchoides avenae]|nr:hypothetical protein AAVH_30033 [Aphelenchus avenae]